MNVFQSAAIIFLLSAALRSSLLRLLTFSLFFERILRTVATMPQIRKSAADTSRETGIFVFGIYSLSVRKPLCHTLAQPVSCKISEKDLTFKFFFSRYKAAKSEAAAKHQNTFIEKTVDVPECNPYL